MMDTSVRNELHWYCCSPVWKYLSNVHDLFSNEENFLWIERQSSHYEFNEKGPIRHLRWLQVIFVENLMKTRCIESCRDKKRRWISIFLRRWSTQDYRSRSLNIHLKSESLCTRRRAQRDSSPRVGRISIISPASEWYWKFEMISKKLYLSSSWSVQR